MNRWEQSYLWIRNFASPLDSAIWRVARFDFTVAQVTNMFTTPLTLLPALPGYYYSCDRMILIRKGDPYATAAGVFAVQWNSATITDALVTAAGNGVLTGAGTRFATEVWRSGTFGRDYSFIDDNSNASGQGLGSKSLRAFTKTANPTVTAALPGSPLTLLLYYVIIPTYQENVGGPISPFL